MTMHTSTNTPKGETLRRLAVAAICMALPACLLCAAGCRYPSPRAPVSGFVQNGWVPPPALPPDTETDVGEEPLESVPIVIPETPILP